MSKECVCRDCEKLFSENDAARCPFCGSPRFVQHPELHTLAIAHLDCDAFFAAVEKRDNPSLASKPLIIGGGKRGVVSTCCYIARQYGIRSAMPMFQALAACPDAVVLKPNIPKYREVSDQVRNLMRQVTEEIEPISIDEAYLDLKELLKCSELSPAQALINLANNLEKTLGITASIGLASNKFLAKLASDFDKPRGFSIIGNNESTSILAPLPVQKINGVGPSLTKRLAKIGINTVSQLQNWKEEDLVERFGVIGHQLANYSRGIDLRPVQPRGRRKSISSETTLEVDINDLQILKPIIRDLSQEVTRRLKQSKNSAQTIVLKLKTSDFKSLTRTTTLTYPTKKWQIVYETALHLLTKEINTRKKFRLIGLGLSKLGKNEEADPPNILDHGL